MPSLSMSVSHRLPQKEAVSRIKQLLGETKQKFAEKIDNLQEEWNEGDCTFSFDAMGFSVSGTMRVGPSNVVLDGKIPWPALPFKGKIEQTIRERATALLA